jgi:hypothetical protein
MAVRVFRNSTIEWCWQRTDEATATDGFNRQCLSWWMKDELLCIAIRMLQILQLKQEPMSIFNEHKNSCWLRSTSVTKRLLQQWHWNDDVEDCLSEHSPWCSSSFSSVEKSDWHKLQWKGITLERMRGFTKQWGALQWAPTITNDYTTASTRTWLNLSTAPNKYDYTYKRN